MLTYKYNNNLKKLASELVEQRWPFFSPNNHPIVLIWEYISVVLIFNGSKLSCQSIDPLRTGVKSGLPAFTTTFQAWAWERMVYVIYPLLVLPHNNL